MCCNDTTSLADAIRCGCKISKPNVHKLYYESYDGEVFTCAIGAAALACDLLSVCDCDGCKAASRKYVDDSDTYTQLKKRWPVLENPSIYPATGLERDTLSNIISLNDIQRWSREEIADWVESVEQNA